MPKMCRDFIVGIPVNTLLTELLYLHQGMVKATVVGKPVSHWNSSTKRNSCIEHDATDIPVIREELRVGLEGGVKGGRGREREREREREEGREGKREEGESEGRRENV